MEQENDRLRERLLARLPQPENLRGYQEETASLLARYEKALFWERWGAAAVWLIAVVFLLLLTLWRGEKWMATPHGQMAELICLVLLIFGAIQLLKGVIYDSRVAILKEVKQLQLQVLQLQAKLDGTD